MAGVHYRHERIGRPVGLELGIMPQSSVLGEHVLVGIDHIGIRMVIQVTHHLKERIRLERIVIIHECDELTLCDRKSRVGILGDPSVLASVNNMEIVVLCFIFGKCFLYRRKA